MKRKFLNVLRLLWGLVIGNNTKKYKAAMDCVSAARALREIGDYGGSAAELEKAIAVFPDKGQLYAEKGWTNEAAGEYGAAVEDLRKAAALGYDNAQVAADIVRNLRLGRRYREALRELDTNAQVRLDAGSVFYERGNILHAMGEYKKALEQYRASISAGRSDKAVYIDMARTLSLMGENRQARITLEKGIRRFPDTVEFYVEIAENLVRAGEFDAAVRRLRNALGFTCEKGAVYRLMAYAYEKAGDTGAAISSYEKACGEGAQTAVMLCRLARLYRASGKRESSVSTLERALKIDPSCGEVYYETGINYEDRGEMTMAAGYYETARTNGYVQNDLFERLGRMHLARGSMGKAKKEFAHALAVSGECPEWRRNSILNQLEFSEGRTKLDSLPTILYLVPTSLCNLDCVMCARKQESGSLSYRVLEKVARYFSAAGVIDWQGGEVFLLDYFREFFEKAAAYPHIRQNITTNGLLIDDNWAKLIASTNTNILFSIDSPVPETYESIRRGADWNILVKSVERMAGALSDAHRRSRMSLTAVVMKRNSSDLEGLPEFCRKYGFGGLCLDFMRPQMQPAENIFIPENAPYLQKVIGAIEKIRDACRELDIKFDCTFMPLLKEHLKRQPANVPVSKDSRSRDAGKSSGPGYGSRIRCRLPWKQLFVDFNGGVKPDCLCRVYAGNLFESGIRDIWNNDFMVSYRKKILNADTGSWCSEECSSGTVRETQFDGGA